MSSVSPRRVLLGGVGVLGLAFAGLVGVIAFNTIRFVPKQVDVPAASVDIDVTAAGNRLAQAVRYKTVSGQGQSSNDQAFADLHVFFEQSFPQVHAQLTRQTVNDYSLLYTWTGTDPSLPPVVLMGHIDVVPVVDATKWTHPPYSGAIEGGYIWGRGTLDDKQNVLGVLEAVEHMLGQGFQPKRTTYLLFGHDEEIGGELGALTVAKRFEAQGIRPWMVLDEGGSIVRDLIGGVSEDIALIGISEKGYVTLSLTVQGAGGHSSMPPPEGTAAGRIARAITRIEANPVPAAIDGPAALMFEHVGPHMDIGNRVALSNRWLLDGVVLSQLTKKSSTNALVRTTTAVTMMQGSPKENVLPSEARAMVNFRIRPGDTVASVKEHIVRAVDDPDVVVAIDGDIGSEPSPVSKVDSEPYRALERTIRAAFPGTVVSPYLVLGATDARHFAPISDHVFRFSAMTLTDPDLERIHGIDERISVEDHGRVVTFYVQLLKDLE